MAATLKLGDRQWATKEGSLLAYNDENNNFKPLPFDFTRASSATRVNKQGLIETVASGVPRIDYSNDANGALKLEPQRSNLVTYSEDFSNPTWAKTNCAITSDNSVSPDGTQNADKLDFTSSNGEIVRTTSGFEVGQEYTMSFYAKTESGTLDFNYGNMNYSMIGGSATTEWKRFEITQTLPVATRFPKIQTTEIGSLLLWGFQLELGSYATSYIPTQGSAVTRIADVCTGAGNDQVFDNNTAVWFIDFSRFGYGSDIDTGASTLRDSSDSIQIRFHFDFPTKTVRFRDSQNGNVNIGGTINTLSNVRKKVALKIDGTTLKVFADGQQIGSDYTRPNVFNFDNIRISNSSFNLFDMKFYNTALTDAELATLTT